MKVPVLFRRRHVWFPSAWGWLVLLLASGAAGLVLFQHAYSFLAPHEPVGAPLLVVEGWMPAEELDQALRVYRDGHYARVVTTGGPIEDGFEPGDGSYAERARRYLVRRGLPADAVVAAPAPASTRGRSYLNAAMVHEWALRSGVAVAALDVFSSGAHSRRSWRLYALAFGPQVRVGIIASTPSAYDPRVWWRTSAGAKEVVAESVAWLWSELFFHPDPLGSDAGG